MATQTAYNYQISVDFLNLTVPGVINPDALTVEINSSTIASGTLVEINIDNDDVEIVFDCPLTSGDVTILDGLIATHTGDDLPDTGIGTDLATVQVREASIIDIDTSFQDIEFSITDVETDDTQLEHDDSDTERIVAKIDNLYKISYHLTVSVGTADTFTFRVLKNDTTLIPGSQTVIDLGGGVEEKVAVTCSTLLTANDYLTLQHKADTNTDSDILANVTMVVTRLVAVQGEQGSTGPAGPAGPTGPSGPGTATDALTYLDTTNKVIGPLSMTPSDEAQTNLWPITGITQDYTIDFTVREVVGGSSPGYYICVSTSSTAPGGGVFNGGINPGTGIDAVLTSGDKVRTTYPT